MREGRERREREEREREEEWVGRTYCCSRQFFVVVLV